MLPKATQVNIDHIVDSNKKVKWVTPKEYSYRCKCGKPGWVEVAGEYPCRECYLKQRGKYGW